MCKSIVLQIWICFQGHWSCSHRLCAPNNLWGCNSQNCTWCSVRFVNCHTGWAVLLHYQWCGYSYSHQAVLEAVIEVISEKQNRGISIGMLVLLETFCILHLLWSFVNFWLNATFSLLNLGIINIYLKYIAKELFIISKNLCLVEP